MTSRKASKAGEYPTIYANATGFGRAAIAVIRISGSRTRSILDKLAGGPPPPRRLTLRRLVDPATGDKLDEALVAWMPAPNSFTGEDQAELHIHGGVAVRTAVLKALDAVPGCRAAEPGEFTRRAFLNGRMDLSQVEGLADLVNADTEAQRRQALRQLEGDIGRRVEKWRERLIGASAYAEAALDFSDEADVAATAEERAGEIIGEIGIDLRACLAEGGRGERLRDGFVVVIAGPPNAGKSTLLNAIARREVALVSPIPGTTRDAIEVRCDLGGLPVTFVDTAGLRDTSDELERAGIGRTESHLRNADLTLWLTAQGGPAATPPQVAGALLRVGSKADLEGCCAAGAGDHMISAKTGAGLPALLDRVQHLAETALGRGDAVLTRQRHRLALERAEAALSRATSYLGRDHTELMAEDLRLALRSLGEITGRVDVEEVLDHVFGEFCIGK